MKCYRLLLILVMNLGTAFLLSCSSSLSVQSRYEASLESLSSAESSETVEIILNYLKSTSVDGLGKSRILYSVYNPQRSALSFQWVGSSTYLEGVRLFDVENPTEYFDVMLDANELEFQQERSRKRVDSGTTLYLDPDVSYAIGKILERGQDRVSLSLLLNNEIISDVFNSIEIVIDP